MGSYEERKARLVEHLKKLDDRSLADRHSFESGWWENTAKQYWEEIFNLRVEIDRLSIDIEELKDQRDER